MNKRINHRFVREPKTALFGPRGAESPAWTFCDPIYAAPGSRARIDNRILYLSIREVRKTTVFLTDEQKVPLELFATLFIEFPENQACVGSSKSIGVR
jgi:hypothetical protein